jgi:outer membrane protein assembly factor BamB
MRQRGLRLGVFVALGAAAGTTWANDWPYWRGPEQTGLSREKAVITAWEPDGENMLWKSDVGGRTAPVVVNGRVYIIGPVGEGECVQERVVCMDAETGKTLWEQRFNVFHADIVENRVGWTALAGDPETGNIYAHATGGQLFCFDRDGQILWQRSLGEEFGRYAGYGGRLHTPIIDEDRVIISIVYILSQWGTGPNKSGHRYLAFDKRTGELVWWAQPGTRPEDTNYSTPVVAVIGGKRMLIAGNADGYLYGLLSRTGEKVWSFQVSKGALHSTPVVEGNYVYITQGEENLDNTVMGRVCCIDASKTGDITKTGEVWHLDGLAAGYASPAIANGRLYVPVNSGKLHAIDAKTGKEVWVHDLGTVMKGSPTVTADGVIYVGEVNGRFHILKDEGNKAASLDVTQFERPDNMVVEIFGSPAVANGRVYFLTRYNTFCLGQKEASQKDVPIPAEPAENAALKDGVASAGTKLQVIPAELTLAPGQERKFKVSAISSDGAVVSENAIEGSGSATWEVKGVNGTMSADGTFHAAKDNAFSAGTVSVKIGDNTGAARIRIGPGLPINESFDKMKPSEPPPGWIGMDVTTKVVEKDGQIVLHKMAENPSAPYSRVRAYSGEPIPAGYTVMADLMAEAKEGGRTPVLSDMGVINDRYKMILLGHEQALRVVSWSPQPRIQKDVPFPWEPKVWYRAKFSVDVKDGKGVVRAKVWPRDQKEPEGWTLEMSDPCPNMEGAPGLYVYTKGTTQKRHGSSVFLDNYQVMRNE